MKCNEIAVIEQAGLSQPGDNLSARITDTNRQVLKVSTDNGDTKYSATLYPSGILHETKTTKVK